MAPLTVTSPAFGDGEPIPDRHAKLEDNVSPELAWSGVPDGTAEFAVICHDPDAPMPWGFTHWVVAGIPADVTGLPEGDGGDYVQGRNDYGDVGYGGPRPPEGHGVHRYYFWVYALDTAMDVQEGVTRAALLKAMADHILEQNRLVGHYER